MSTFRNKHLDILKKIKGIDFNKEKTKKLIKFIEEKNILEYDNKDNNLSEINILYSPNEVISKFEKYNIFFFKFIKILILILF